MLPSGRGEGGCELARAAGTAPQAVGLNRDYLVEGENRCINVVSALPAREPRGGDNNRHAGAAIGKESSAAALVPWGEWVCCPELTGRGDSAVTGQSPGGSVGRPQRLGEQRLETAEAGQGTVYMAAGERLQEPKQLPCSLEVGGGGRGALSPAGSPRAREPNQRARLGPKAKGLPPLLPPMGPAPQEPPMALPGPPSGRRKRA